METVRNFAPAAGRVLLALTFLLGGIGKFTDPVGQAGYMDAYGVPSILLYPAALLEVLAALALIVGFQARWAAAALAAFTLIATVLFHFDLGDAMQQLFLLKNLAIIGGLAYVFAYGAGAYAIDKN